MNRLSEQRIAQVVGEQVVLAKERAPNYHNDLAATLVKVVRVQSDESTNRFRQKQVKRIIEDLGTQVLTQQQESK